MAEQIISPGVFTRENDLSFLPQGIGQIGAAIIGPTVKGPAFVPTVVRSFAEYERKFGSLSSETYVPQTVREYLRNAGSVTVCRVLAGGGYRFTNATNEPVAILVGSGSTTSGATFASASLDIAKHPTGALHPGGADEITIGGVDFTFVSASAGLSNSSTQIFVNFGPTTSSAATNLAGAINNSSSLHNLAITASQTAAEILTGIIALSGSAAGTAGNTTITTGSGGDVTSTTSAFVTNASKGMNMTGGTNLSTSGGKHILVGVIYPSKNTSTPNLSKTIIEPVATANAPVSASFNIILSGSFGAGSSKAFSASINPNNQDYLFKQLGTSPNNSKSSVSAYAGTPGYGYVNFKSLQKSIVATSALSGYGGIGSGSKILKADLSSDLLFNGNLGQAEGYSYASTPFITSQFLDSNKTTQELFKFHTLMHGTKCNKDYKISLANLKTPNDIDGVEQYSTFSVLVRKYTDKDQSPVILEQYNNVSLDPNSSNYICRVIGDRFPQYNDTLGKVELLGNYPNVSDYIRVEANTAVDERATSPKLSPKGFKAVSNPIATASLAIDCTFPSSSLEGKQTLDGTNYSTKGYLGWKFNDKESDNENFLLPLPSSPAAESNVSGDFNVENYLGHASSSLYVQSLSASIDATGVNGPTNTQLKFTVPFQGGFDGMAPYTVRQIGAQIANSNLYGFDLSSATTSGSIGYKKAINILANQDEYDINMVVLPGVIKNLHSNVTNAVIEMVEERGDAFYVMDLCEVDKSVNQAITTAAGLDTNYAGVYYPWVKVLDTNANKPVLVPPSVIVPGAIAQSDSIAAEWFAPAGLNRGVLGNVLEAKIRLNQAERDKLYDAKINPIATFPQTGVCIWGQKTLQERSTALNRINVRRLLIALKKFIASSSRYLVFEQNTQATRNRFLNIVNPYLESVQQRQGLYAFRVQMDEGNNTPDIIDRNQLVGAIYLQPTKTAEFIVLDFNVLPTGATFDTGGGAGGTGGGGY